MPQKAANSRPGNGQLLLAAALVLIILSPLGYSLVRGVIPNGAETSPERPDPKHVSCVVDKAKGIETTRDMRFHHWELLRGIREEVVRYGKRGTIGLTTCKECHPSRERFCDRCHHAVSLTPDCFECHNYP